MPKRIPDAEFEAIVSVISGHSEGIGVAELRGRLPFTLAPKALYRRLQRLIEEGRIRARGSRKGRRYLPVTGPPAPAPRPHPAAAPAVTLELSPGARSINDLIARPLNQRKPVGYQSGFLEDYDPGHDFYLPATVRRELAEAGQVGISDLPAGTYVRQVLDRLLVDLSFNSSRLEGNTYSLLETRRLLEQGESARGKRAEETQMILNHKAAIEMLADQADEIGFNRYTICNLHGLLSDNLLADPAAGGRLRDKPVGITGTVYHPLEVPQQIAGRLADILAKLNAIEDPFEQSFFCMVHLPYLQPFEDVNKRVSRLAANIPLIKANFCPLSFTEVAQEEYVTALIGVYELNEVDYLRDLFVWAYRRSAAQYAAVRQSLGDPDPFRLTYRSRIGSFVREIVQDVMNSHNAAHWIELQAEKEINELDRNRFIEVVATELDSLHEGNIARYRLRPSEFEAWAANWK